MDVSNRNSKIESAPEKQGEDNLESIGPAVELKRSDEPFALDGERLLQTVASLTGLPTPLVTEELGQILELSGQDSASLTLEELRAAMLNYLETIQHSMSDVEPN